MLFNSFVFLLVFLPLTMLVFQLLASAASSQVVLQSFLFAASCVFLAYESINSLALLLVSLVVNYALLRRLTAADGDGVKRLWLRIAIVFNLCFLGVFKYADFIWSSFGFLTAQPVKPLGIALPLAISFYTFEMMALAIDIWRERGRAPPLLQVGLYASIFPHLIAGPIVRFREVSADLVALRPIHAVNMALGLSIFFAGLFKKTIIADSLAPIANTFFAAAQAGEKPGLIEAWAGALSYCFQIYFDFSGYTDMAIGLALIFGVRLPQNFYSPYKATSIIEFWRRWHITLSRYLRDYLYVPLGGGRKGELLRWRNVFITMLLGGLWHGASWNFVIWGGGHGLLIAANHSWRRYGRTLSPALGWLLTFICVTALWVIFRVSEVSVAMKIYAGMVGANGVILPLRLASWLEPFNIAGFIKFQSSELVRVPDILIIASAAFVAFALPNMEQLFRETRSEILLRPLGAVVIGCIGTLGIFAIHHAVPFIYFRF